MFSFCLWCCCSVAESCPTLCDPMDCSPPGLPVHHQLPEFIQTHVHWVSDDIQPTHPLVAPSPPAFTLFQHQGLFKWVSSSHLVAKELSFGFSISPSNEYSGLISFGKDCLDLLTVQELSSVFSNTTFKSIISSALSFLYSLTFTSIHDYWENHSFDKTDLFGKVMSLLFNMLSRLFMAFLPRINLLLISWLPSSSTVILEPKK